MVTEVMFSRLIGVALMNSPFTMTVWFRCAGRLNSDTPMSVKVFLPAGGVAGVSLAAGAFALLGAGSVAVASVQLLGVASFRQPVTLTISIFCDGAAWATARPRITARIVMRRMIPPVTRRAQFSIRCYTLAISALAVVGMVALGATVSAHDLERTQVTLTFARDGSFVLDVANDPRWLTLRLEPFRGSFADRIVLWVDGREIRPASVEYLPPPGGSESPGRRSLGGGGRDSSQGADGTRATYRLRGRMPLDAHTLRWYYGLVIDPYPLTIRRADGRVLVEEIGGDAWSRAIDLSGQFHAPLLNQNLVGVLLVGLLLVPAVFRIGAALQRHRRIDTKDTMDTKEECGESVLSRPGG